jgi:hypothetical protein
VSEVIVEVILELVDDPLMVLQWAPAFFWCAAPVFDPGASLL